VPQQVSYPATVKETEFLFSDIEHQIMVKTNSDSLSCQVLVSTQIIKNRFLCDEFSFYCETKVLETVQRTTDYTCAREFRAKEILFSRSNASCSISNQDLSAEEMTHLNNPSIYIIKTPDVNGEAIASFISPTATIPLLKEIRLDADCRCVYTASGWEGKVTYEYPALEEHCRAHFGAFYQ
jgi:hypothetical protein